MPSNRCTIKLGGDDFDLRFDMNAVAAFEEQTGRAAALVLQDVEACAKTGVFMALVYAGMQHDKRLAKGMSMAKVGRLMTPLLADQEAYGNTLNTVLGAFLGAFGVDMTKVQEQAEADASENPQAAPSI